MKKYHRNISIEKSLKEELNNGWWYWFSEYYDSLPEPTEYDEQNYKHVDASNSNGGRYQPYLEIDMNSFYSVQKQREKKIETILNNNSEEKDLTTRLIDFYNNAKNRTK